MNFVLASARDGGIVGAQPSRAFRLAGLRRLATADSPVPLRLAWAGRPIIFQTTP